MSHRITVVRKTRKDTRLEQAGWTLSELVAKGYPEGRDHLERNLAVTDGYSTGTPEVMVSGSAELTTVEAAAQARMQIHLMIGEGELLHQRVREVVRDLSRWCTDAVKFNQPRSTQPADKTDLCCSNQHGRHRAEEWGDALCLDRAYADGLCASHYKKWRLACIKDGVWKHRDEPAQGITSATTSTIDGVTTVRDQNGTVIYSGRDV